MKFNQIKQITFAWKLKCFQDFSIIETKIKCYSSDIVP